MSTADLMSELDRRVVDDYPFLRTDANPVLVGEVGAAGLGWALGQYCFLPLRIVELLGAMAAASYTWPRLHEELLRNIGEECGGRTKERSHVAILRQCLNAELDYDLTRTVADPLTDRYLDALLDGVRRNRGRREFVAGMAYAMETSALPELRVAAELVNRAAVATGRGDVVVKHLTEDMRYARQLLEDKSPDDYTLDDFFVAHLLCIEVEHQSGLRSVILKDVRSPSALADVEAGFRFALDTMAAWWAALARRATDLPR